LLPDLTEFVFETSQLSTEPRPATEVLLPPTAVKPAPNEYYPIAPQDGYRLVEDSRYQRGYVYIADYDVSYEALEAHKEQLSKLATPPNVHPEVNDGVTTVLPIPGMVRLIPGVPFAFAFNGDRRRLHTIACAHTLESLSHYADFPQTKAASVRLAKLTWGCVASRNNPSIPPIFELPGLKENDRSPAREHLHMQSGDGSFNLASTVMKGEGMGTVLPAVQADTEQAKTQRLAILRELHTLYRLVMPKCLSKFEMTMSDFDFDMNNVFGFGGLEPCGTSVQMNVSSLGELLAHYIGKRQGGWHRDKHDHHLDWTLFTLLLRVGPSKLSLLFRSAISQTFQYRWRSWAFLSCEKRSVFERKGGVDRFSRIQGK